MVTLVLPARPFRIGLDGDGKAGGTGEGGGGFSQVVLAATSVAAHDDNSMETGIVEGAELVEEMVADDFRRHAAETRICLADHLLQPWPMEATLVDMIALRRGHDTPETARRFFAIVVGF